jgi:hypothetical protein
VADLLDHFVAVHRPLSEQGKDGRTDVAAPAATAASATMASSSASGPEAEARPETSASTSWAESRAEPGSPASCSGAGADLVLELFTHLALGFAPGVVQSTPAVGVQRVEAEPADFWAVIRALEWVSQCVSRF